MLELLDMRILKMYRLQWLQWRIKPLLWSKQIAVSEILLCNFTVIFLRIQCQIQNQSGYRCITPSCVDDKVILTSSRVECCHCSSYTKSWHIIWAKYQIPKLKWKPYTGIECQTAVSNSQRVLNGCCMLYQPYTGLGQVICSVLPECHHHQKSK